MRHSLFSQRSLTGLILSLFLLTACGSGQDKQTVPVTPSSSAKVVQSSTPKTKSSSVKAKAVATVQSSPASSQVATESSAVAQASSPETVASSQVLSEQAVVTESATQSEPVSQPAPEVAESSPSAVIQEPNQPVATEIAIQPAETLQPRFTATPIAPGAVAGQWGNWLINEDGTFQESPLVITDRVDLPSGVIYLRYMDTLSGWGGYLHYYPAGVPIPFEHFADPTDLSRERLIMGTGGYLNYPEEMKDEILNEGGLLYR